MQHEMKKVPIVEFTTNDCRLITEVLEDDAVQKIAKEDYGNEWFNAINALKQILQGGRRD